MDFYRLFVFLAFAILSFIQHLMGAHNKYLLLFRFGVKIAEEELSMRAEVLRKNLMKIKHHNAGPSSYKMGVNQVIQPQ